MKRIALLIASVMLFALIAGCGSPVSSTGSSAGPVENEQETEVAVTPSAEETRTDTEAAEEASEPEMQEFAEEAEVDEPEPTGAIIPAEECQAKGYDVRYGMFDFETYVELPLVDKQETLTYWFMMQPFMMGYNNITENDFTYFHEMESRTGIHMDLTAVSLFSAAEQFALMLTSGDYTDLVEGAITFYTGGGTKAIEDGFLIDMLDYLDVMPNMEAWLHSDPSYLPDVLTLDGQLPYAPLFSEVERNVGPQFRGDWLDQLGLEPPTTYDEYHDVLAAIRDAYGAGLWLDNKGTQRNNVLSAGYDVHVNQDQSTRPFRVIDGTVEFSPATEDYRSFMQLMNAWWDEGLIYQDFLAQQNVSSPDFSALLNGQIGAWATDSGTMASYDDLSDEIDVRPAPLPRKEAGQTLHLYAQSGAVGDGTAITSSCGDPELAARWLDYNYTYDGTLLCGYGVEGEGLTFDENGTPMYSDLVLNNPDMITVACSLVYSKYNGAAVIDAYRFSPGYTQKQKDAIALWLNNLDTTHEYPAAVQFTIEESGRYSKILSDLQTYASQCALQFITGEMSPDSDWDNYFDTLKSLEVDELEALCQTAYDRYLTLGTDNGQE